MAHTATHSIDQRLKQGQWGLTAGITVFGLVATYVVVVPNLSLLPNAELYNEKRLLQLGVFLAVAFAYLSSDKLKGGVTNLTVELPSAVKAGLAAITLLGVTSAIRAEYSVYAFLELGHFMILFFIAAAIACVVMKSPMQWSRVIGGIIILSVALFILKFIVSYLAVAIGGVGSLWPNGATGFDNIRFFNQFQTWTLPLIAASPLLIKRDPKWIAASLYALASAWWMLLFASGGRGTGLAMVAAGIAVCLIFGNKGWPWIKHQIATCAGGAMSFLLFFHVLASSESSLLHRDLAGGGRPEAWGDALQMMMQAPVLGVGPMHYANFSEGALWAHPHNGLLQWGAEFGIVSLLIISAIALFAFASLARQVKRVELKGNDAMSNEFIIGVTLIATLVAGGAHTFVSGTLVMPLSQMMLVLMVGWAWGIYRSEDGMNPDPKKVTGGKILIAAICLASISIALPVSQDIPTLSADRAEFIQEQQVTRIYPRYWQQGYFGY